MNSKKNIKPMMTFVNYHRIDKPTLDRHLWHQFLRVNWKKNVDKYIKCLEFLKIIMFEVWSLSLKYAIISFGKGSLLQKCFQKLKQPWILILKFLHIFWFSFCTWGYTMIHVRNIIEYFNFWVQLVLSPMLCTWRL